MVTKETVAISKDEYDELRAVEEEAWRLIMGAQANSYYSQMLHHLRVLYDIREKPWRTNGA